MTLYSNFLLFLPLTPLPGCCRHHLVAKSLSHVWLFVTHGLYFFKSTAPWSIGALRCCVNFCCAAKWPSYTHTHTHTYAHTRMHTHMHAHVHSFSYFLHYGLSQDIEYSSLGYTVGPCSSILYVIGFFCYPSDSQSIPSPPLPTLATTSLLSTSMSVSAS